MSWERVRGPGGLTRAAAVAAVMALVPGAALAAAGGAAARGQAAATGIISTVAGGVGGPGKATRVALYGPCGVSYGAGRMQVADGWAVRTVNPRTGQLATPAGVAPPPKPGFGGDGGPASAAMLFGACGTTADRWGNLLIADGGNNRIRVVAHTTGTFYGQPMTAGDIYTIAGDGTLGDAGDGGPAVSAELNQPGGVTVDRAGNVLIVDSGGNRIRVMAARSGRFYQRTMTAGDIYGVAGAGPEGFAGDGGLASRAELNDPSDVAVDSAGNVIIADARNGRIRVVAHATGTFYGQPMTAGDIYTIAGDDSRLLGDGGPATSAELSLPYGIAVDGAGNLIIADAFNERIRVVAASTGTFYGQSMTAGDIYTVAGDGIEGFAGDGDGGPATSAKLSDPHGVTVDGAGNLIMVDTDSMRIRVVAHGTGVFYGQAMTAGDIYTIAGNGNQVSGAGGRATHAELGFPTSVASDAAGNLIIAVATRVQVVAASTGTLYGQPVIAGDLYNIAGDGGGRLGDGGPATSAKLKFPDGLAADGAGNLIIADSFNQRIRVVAARTATFYGQAMTAGDIYTIAGDGARGFAGDGGPATHAELNNPGEVAVDGAGNLIIADSFNNRIRVVAARTATFYGQAMTAGDIYTIAGDGAGHSGDGGPATSAKLSDPEGVATDAAGNLIIADTRNKRIRVVAARTATFYGQPMTAGDIYTIAGDGTKGFSGDGGPATSAALRTPGSVATDGAGNLIIADTGNQRIRVVAASTGTFYGQAMTAGDIYTVAGDGTPGFSGDGGPAASAALFDPEDVATDGAGNLIIADSSNNRIREVRY